MCTRMVAKQYRGRHALDLGQRRCFCPLNIFSLLFSQEEQSSAIVLLDTSPSRSTAHAAVVKQCTAYVGAFDRVSLSLFFERT